MKITLKEKAIVSSFTLISSLTGFYYAKSNKKEVMPYVMIGGFMGALLGEALAETFCPHEITNSLPSKRQTALSGSIGKSKQKSKKQRTK
ncbi:MAG: hypothetical protein HYY40_13915 [Bacteroidetes bacterium]|nr:hypothetical protein [Bacteroidota bacterium]